MGLQQRKQHVDMWRQEASSNKCHASSNRCLTSSNKKLLGTGVITNADLPFTVPLSCSQFGHVFRFMLLPEHTSVCSLLCQARVAETTARAMGEVPW